MFNMNTEIRDILIQHINYLNDFQYGILYYIYQY